MTQLKRYRGLIVASLALAAVMAVFVYEGFALYAKTVAYARSDLQARAELAALVLEEPLGTQDFKAIGEFDADCRAKGIELTIYHRDGVFFGRPREASGWEVSQPCGEYRLRLAINGKKILLPFLGALAFASLAFLVGVAGMVFFFFVFYRQRAKLAEMKRLEKERYDFVTEFTHNLKTPLTGIIAAADMMEGDKLADMIKSSAHRLDQLAQDLIYVYWGKGLRGAEIRGAEPANQDRVRGAEPANQDRAQAANQDEPANRAGAIG